MPPGMDSTLQSPSPVESFFGLMFKLAAARIELGFSNLMFKALRVPTVVLLFALSPLEPGPSHYSTHFNPLFPAPAITSV